MNARCTSKALTGRNIYALQVWFLLEIWNSQPVTKVKIKFVYPILPQFGCEERS